MFPCEFCEIFKNTFSYRTPLDGCIWLKLYHQIKNQTFNVKFVIKFVHSVFWHFSHNIRTKYGERCETQEVETPLRERYPNTEFFLVHIFPHSDWIQRDTEHLSIFSPNARKYGPENVFPLLEFRISFKLYFVVLCSIQKLIQLNVFDYQCTIQTNKDIYFSCFIFHYSIVS